MAPQQLYPGKRILRRRRRRNSDCPRCRGQESHSATSSGDELDGAPTAGAAQAEVVCASAVRPQRLWENRVGETTEYFMKLSTIILAVVSFALAIALIAVHYSKTSQVDQVRVAYLRMSNDWNEAHGKLADSGKLVEVLQTDLAARSESLVNISN